MILPYQSSVPMERFPWANIGLIALTVVVSVAGFVDSRVIERLALGERDIPAFVRDLPAYPAIAQRFNDAPVVFHPHGYFTHGLVHGGVIHLAGNMLFLFVFGNAVNAKLGHVRYLLAYAVMLVGAAAVHVWFVGAPAVGASGAIYGVLGMFIVFFPRNDVSCFWFAFYRLREHFGTFDVSAIWIVLYWVGVNIVLMTLDLAGDVGVEAHLGGFACGLAAGLLLVILHVVQSTAWEENLVELLRLRR